MATSETECSVPGCKRTAKKRGWCETHYSRWRTNGDLELRRAANGEPQRYLREVVFPYDGEECLIWPYAKAKNNAARISIDGRLHNVSRLACEARNGPPPDPNLDAAHSCGNGHLSCVNPSHMRWDTRVGNMADTIDHGTRIRGEKHGGSKITELQAREIIRLRGVETGVSLARRFGVARSVISRIQTGVRWAWLRD